MGSPIKKDVTIGNCRLILGDCLQVMPLLGKVDAVVTDPPYGINFKQRTTGKRIAGDEYPFDPKFLLKFGDKQIIWGGDNFAHHLPHGRWLVWIKRAVEIAAPKSYGDCEVAWCSDDGCIKAMRLISDGCIRQGLEHGIRRVHPSQKPIEIMEWCLGFLPDAQTILDPFMGSGTTLVACAKLGRKGIGIELDPDYFEIACERVREAYRQPDLFVPAPSKPIQMDAFEDNGDLP